MNVLIPDVSKSGTHCAALLMHDNLKCLFVNKNDFSVIILYLSFFKINFMKLKVGLFHLYVSRLLLKG